MHCWILFSLPGSKDHESRDLCCLVLHSSPILPIVPDPEHTLRKIWWINTWSRCALCRGPQWKGILYSSWESCNLCEKEFCLIETMLKAVYLNYSPSHILPHREGERKLQNIRKKNNALWHNNIPLFGEYVDESLCNQNISGHQISGNTS